MLINTTCLVHSQSICPAMVALNLGDTHSRFAIICADSEEVPLSLPKGNVGLANANFLRLSLRFRLNEDSMYIDEEVVDALSRNLTHSIEQSLVCDGNSKQ